MNDADEVIERLKERFGVDTDSALASKLMISRSSIANWRNRNSVAHRYRQLAEGKGNLFTFGGEMTDIERAAMRLVVLRLTREYGDIATDYRTFLTKSGEASSKVQWYFTRACQDLVNEMHARGSDNPLDCVNLLAFNEAFSDTDLPQ